MQIDNTLNKLTAVLYEMFASVLAHICESL